MFQSNFVSTFRMNYVKNIFGRDESGIIIEDEDVSFSDQLCPQLSYFQVYIHIICLNSVNNYYLHSV